MVVTSVEYPGGVHQIICTIGHLIVLTGAIIKGKSEVREMINVGIRKYFQATVTFCISDVYHKLYILLFLIRVLVFLKIIYHLYFVLASLLLIFFVYSIWKYKWSYLDLSLLSVGVICYFLFWPFNLLDHLCL